MGCGVSKEGGRARGIVRGMRMSREEEEEEEEQEERGLRLGVSRASLSRRQLVNLNKKFNKMLEANSHFPGKCRERQIACIDVVVERLIQRLICNVGILDSRFSSKFLVNLEPQRLQVGEARSSRRYKYLVRLDGASDGEEGCGWIKVVEGEGVPEGYGKVRVQGAGLEEWVGFVNSSGFLRRDKIQERFVELLAKAAARPIEPLTPDQVDESRLCGSPGKIVDPITLHHILKTPPDQQVFFGPAECNESRFPDPRDFRIAIVEGAPDTRLHISFLSPTAQSITAEEDVEISLTLGIGVAGWPTGTDYPFRLPLDHVDVILGYKAAQLGYYLVPKGPHTSVVCEDRSAVWEVSTPGTEMYLEHHYSPGSVVFRVLRVLVYLLDILRARGMKSVNRYILKSLLFFELEHYSRVHQWSPKMISRRVFSILDRLLGCLKKKMIPSYIFTRKNLLLQDETLEEDFVSDGEILEHYLHQLCNDELMTNENKSDGVLIKDQLENVLVQKWRNVVSNMVPVMSNRTTRLSVINNSPASVSYTRQQMEYIAVLLREILSLKNIQKKNSFIVMTKSTEEQEERTRNREDFIYLLQILFEQAKHKLLSIALRSKSRRVANKKTLKLDHVMLSYDMSTALLVDDIRKSETMDFNFSDDTSIVVKLMECLYKAIDSDGRVLGPVLRPYLNQIFRGSHENCWFLVELKKRTDLSQFHALGAFTSLVLSEAISPLEGILNSAAKGWSWAIRCLQIMENIKEESSTRVIIGEKMDSSNSGLRLIFTPCPGQTIRHTVCLPSARTTEPSRSDDRADSRYATIKSFKDILDSTILADESNYKRVPSLKSLKHSHHKQPPHVQLRDGNPFTIASWEVRRQGNHRGLGSIIQALISLQKLTVLQEVSQYLPEQERTRVLNDIKKLSKEIQRLAVESSRKKQLPPVFGPRTRFSFKKSGETLPMRMLHPRRLSYNSLQSKVSDVEGVGIYRSLSELSVCREKTVEEKKVKKVDGGDEEESLLKTCRQLRRNSKPIFIDSRAANSLANANRHRTGPSTFPKSVINTPFYIKIFPYNSKLNERL